MSDRDELRHAVADAIRSAPISTNAFAEADAAIAAYEAHRPRAEVMLTREEWGRNITRAQVEWWTSQDKDDETAMSLTLRAAFLWIKVEGE